MKNKIIDFSKFSSLKIGDSFNVEIIENSDIVRSNSYLIGSCNNILIGKNPPKLSKLSKDFDYIKIENNQLKIGGATPSGKIISFCKKNNIANFEFISQLPGTLGGLVKMNAGLKNYEIFNYLTNIYTDKLINKDKIDYGYRKTDIAKPILEASFILEYGFDNSKIDMFKIMRINQPKLPSAGSCFKNPIDDYAGRLIEEVGLKGFRVGDMEFSSQHANFLVNLGHGVFSDAIYLIEEAKKRVYEKFKINLECEIIILDKSYMNNSLEKDNG